MAKSSVNKEGATPKGMAKFLVLGATIKDSLGQYCNKGDYATLDKKLAQHYLNLNMIRVELPDMDDEDDVDRDTENEGDGASEQTSTAASAHRGKTKP